MESIIKYNGKGFLFKILELKTGKKFRSFKNEYFLIIKEGSRLKGIKRISKITDIERRFISRKDFLFSSDNKLVFNMWTDKDCSEEIKSKFKEAY